MYWGVIITWADLHRRQRLAWQKRRLIPGIHLKSRINAALDTGALCRLDVRYYI